MPGIHELIWILVAIFAIWFILKMAKVALRLIILVIALLIAGGLVYYLFFT